MRDGVRAGDGRAPEGKRDRTRARLLDAALRVFAQKGIGAASIQEVTVEAEVANGTFYNYFRSKDELVAAVSGRLAARFADDVALAYAEVDDPAERVAIGLRSFVAGAISEPSWGWALVRMTDAGGSALQRLVDHFLRDLRAGKRHGRFRVRNERAAIDLVFGTAVSAMRTVLEGRAGGGHASAVAALVLRALGVPAAQADEVARRPLPGRLVEVATERVPRARS
jgi:AcrR family transcriptional regulator